jgi:hypothetical protein
MFGQSLFASKLFFFLPVLVSAKDEYEQYSLLSRKKMSSVRKKISSVFMFVVLIDEENLLDCIRSQEEIQSYEQFATVEFGRFFNLL